MVFAFIASATQDIATDAFAILTLKKGQRSFGNSMQSAGTFLGTLVGSGVLLVIYHYLGWKYLLFALAGFVLLALLPVTLSRFASEQKIGKYRKSVSLSDVAYFFRQRGISRRVLLLFLYYSGMIGVLTMLKPFLVDHGFSVKEIGFVSGIFGTAMGSACALLAGFIIRRVGYRISLFLFSFSGIVAVAYFYYLTQTTVSIQKVYIGVALLWSAYAMSSVIIYTISMNAVRKGREGTDFTIQIVITHLSGLIIAVSSGKIADAIGYNGLFFAELILAIIVFLLIFVLYRQFHNTDDYDCTQKTIK